MKFQYEYRTSDNVRHTDTVRASNREAAFQALRRQGIKPGRLEEAPGLLNHVLGKGKRWIAIGGLACALVGVVVVLLREETAVLYAAEDRSQVFGDPSVIQKLSRLGWRETFSDAGEAWMARHAIPGRRCMCSGNADDDAVIRSLESRRRIPIRISNEDPDELKKMKRIVNGMKAELNAFVESPTDVVEYMHRACERVRVEEKVYENIRREIMNIERSIESGRENRDEHIRSWDKKNEALRSMGLPTIPLPE